jgi:hypothetical protein
MVQFYRFRYRHKVVLLIPSFFAAAVWLPLQAFRT